MKLLLTGATGQIGHFLLQHLNHASIKTIAVSRYSQQPSFNEKWIVCDLLDHDPFVKSGKIDTWIHAGLLTMTLPWLESATHAGVKRLVSFSSTSVFTKIDSSSDAERKLVSGIREAEDAIAEQCKRLGIHWTILRPTLIYGRGTDQNISFIISMIRRFGFFPVAGDGSSLRQPVHADDLAQAALEVLNQDNAFDRSYNLSGGETLSYRKMVERVFKSLNRPPRIISINPLIYKAAIAILKRISPRYAFVQTSMVDRMNMDMVFDHADAKHDFGYNPRPFQP